MNQELPDIEIDFLKNRDAEIWKPILRIVHGSKYYDNLLALCRKQVEKRRRDKGDTLEAVIFGIVKQLTAKNPEIAFEEVWSKVREEPGQDDAKNPQAYILQDHGKVTKTYIGKILTEKFKGVKDREGNKRIYRFDAKIITKLERKYGSHGSHGSSNEEEAKTTSEIGSNHEGNVIKNDQPDLSKTIQTIQTVHVNDALTVEGSEFRVKRIEGNLHTIKCLVCNDTPTIRADNRQELEKKLRTHIDLFHIGGRTN